MDMEPFYIPGSLNEPVRVGPLTIDEFLGGVVGLIGGFAGQYYYGAAAFLAGFGFAIAWVVILKMIKAREGGNIVSNFKYWHFPSSRSFLVIPRSYKRDFWG